MLDPLDPLSAIVCLPNHRETHLAKKCLPMRLPISPRRLNPLKKSSLKPHDYEFHSRTDASPGWPPCPVRENRSPPLHRVLREPPWPLTPGQRLRRSSVAGNI